MLGLTPLDLVVLSAYFGITIAIGLLAQRLIHDRESFIMGGRRFGKAMMIMFAFGSGTHAENAVGVAAQSYKVGFAGIWYQWVMLFTLPVYWLLAPIFRRARVQTTADFFERRYGTGFMLLYAVFALFVLVSMTSAILYGSSRMVQALTGGALSWQLSIVIIATISFLYAIMGGLIAAVWNDFLQGILTIVMSVLLIPFFWIKIGGLKGFQQALPDPSRTFQLVLSSDITLYWIIAMSVNSLFSMVVQPHIMANTGAAKTEMDSRVGFVGGLALKRLMTVPWALTGVMAIAYFGPGAIEMDHAYGAMARAFLPGGFTGLMLACVMASVMDNCAISMLSFAGIYTNSIHRYMKSGVNTEARLVYVSRVAATCFGILSVALAYAFTDVPTAMRFLWNTIPLMGVPFFLAICWRRTNRYGAFAGFGAALFTMLIGQYGLDWTGDPGLPKVITLFLSSGLLAGIVTSLLTPPEPKNCIQNFFLLLRTPIGEENILRQAGFRELPGTGTFEMPTGTELGGDVRPPRESLIKSSRHAVYGFIAVSMVMLIMLAGVKALAAWLAGDQG